MLRRTVTCGELRDAHIGQTITLNGWVNSYRDHGNLIFIDLRDRFGLTQLVFDPDDGASKEMMEAADKLRNEDVVACKGVVRKRIGGPNLKLHTGTIEIVVKELQVLSKTANPPFLPDDMAKLPNEEIRLKHRYIDLRRPKMQHILGLRHRVMQSTRRYFDENGFLEVETPILYKSTPEGAREFLVPNRHVPGSWYALPQSPQLFKQILMVSGCDRYMQICRCFRDEDPRADRQAEFSQIDLEMSFVRREHVMEMMEGFARRLWKDVLGIEVPRMHVMSYREAMEQYGIDRPDTRYDLKTLDISELAATTEFGVFKTALEKGKDRPKYNSKKGVVKCIRVPGGADKLTRKLTDGYTDFVKGFGAGGVAVVKVLGGPPVPGGSSEVKLDTGIAKFLEPVKAEFLKATGALVGDTVLFVADTYSVATKAIGELRQKVARDMGIVPQPGADGGPWNFLWVIDFPMFERNKETGKWVAMHHPFTSPRDDQMQAFLNADTEDEVAIEAIVSAGYDMVLNGSEIAGGSVRIHSQEVQSKVFKLLGMTPESAREKFSFLLEALAFGAPPHAGIAFGLDRLIMHLVGTDNIRDVIAFPKTQIGQDLMTGAPGFVTEPQLKDLYVKNVLPEPIAKPN